MKKFKIKVNGEVYDVEVEELGGSSGCYAAPAPVTAVAPRPAPVAAVPAATAHAPVAIAPKSVAAKPTAGGGGGGAVCAPMPGTILDVRVKAGDAVKAGDVLLILEAMKMENELTADKAGTVKEVMVSKGKAVSGGETLIIIG